MIVFFFQAEDGIRDLVRSRGLGDVYKRQKRDFPQIGREQINIGTGKGAAQPTETAGDAGDNPCLLYTSDAADERSSVDLGGRRIIKKKTDQRLAGSWTIN